jgi:hypothetical protein
MLLITPAIEAIAAHLLAKPSKLDDFQSIGKESLL